MTDNDPPKSTGSDVDGLLTFAALGLMAAGAGKLAGSAGKWFTDTRRGSQRNRALGPFQQSMAAIGRGDLASAARLAQAAIDADLQFGEAYSALAWILARQRIDLQRALALANHALSLPASPPQVAGYLNSRAEVWAQMGDHDMAMADSRACLERVPDHRAWPGPPALQRLGTAQMLKHDLPAAYGTLRRALDLGIDHHELRILLAQVTRERHYYDESIGHWEAAIRQVRASPPPGTDLAYMTSMLLNDLGATHFHAGDADKAEALQRRATEICPGNPYPWLNCAIAAGRRDDVARMRGLMNRTLDVAHPHDEHLVSAILAQAISDDHGDVMLGALREHHRISERQHADCMSAWHGKRQAGQTYITNTNITNSDVGVVAGPGSAISGVDVRTS